MVFCVVLLLVALVVILMVVAFNNEQTIVEKAQRSKNMFNFYHMLALMTSSTYKGYIHTKEEQKAMEEFLDGNSEYDAHPVGSYLKMREENKQMLQSVACPSFNMSDVGIGLAVMLVFIGVVLLGVTFS